MTVQLLILKVRAAAARSASGGSTRPPAGSKHSHQNKLLVVSDVAFQERLFPRSNELLLCATHRCCLFSVLSHSVSLAFVFYAVYLQAQKPLWRLNFSVGLILAEACKAFIEDKVSFWRKMPLREPNCTEYVTQTHRITCVLAAKEATCTLPTSWHCTKSLRPLSFSSGSCSCSRMTTVFMWMSFKEPFPFQQAVLISWCLPHFLGKEGGLGQPLPPVGWPPLHDRPAGPWLCPGALLNTCGQDHSLKHSREIIQLLKNLGGKNITPGCSHLPTSPPAPSMCTGSNFTLPFLSCCGHLCADVHLTICFGSLSMAITWLFVGFTLQDQCVLHPLAWPEDTNSPEGHFWVMPCRIPGEHDFFHLFFL